MGNNDDEEDDWNPRREAAEAIHDVREILVEILATPSYDEEHIDAKRHAASAIDGLDDAEEALRLWRDEGEEPISSLDEEEERDVEDALKEIRAAASDELREATMGELLEAAGRSRGDDDDHDGGE